LAFLHITTDRSIDVDIVEGRSYSITYKDEWYNTIDVYNFTASQSFILHVVYTTANTFMSCDLLDFPPAYMYMGLSHAGVQETYTFDDGDVNEDGIMDEYTKVGLEGAGYVGSDIYGEITIPAAYGSFGVSNLMIDFRGNIMSVKQVAKMLNKTINQVMSVTILGQKLGVHIKAAVIGQVIQIGVNLVFAKLGIAEADIPSVTFEGDPGDPSPMDALVPVYRSLSGGKANHHDYDRKSFLGKLTWSTSKISTGGTFKVEIANDGTGLVELYDSPDKGAKYIIEGRARRSNDPGAVVDYYVKGIAYSSNTANADVKITIVFTPDDGSDAETKDFELKVYDLVVEPDVSFTGFNDNKEAASTEFPFPGLMVPLGAGGSPGTNKFKVKVNPANLASKFKVTVVNPSQGGVSVNHTGNLTSANQAITVTGTTHVSGNDIYLNAGPLVRVVKSGDGGTVASLWTDVKKRLENHKTYEVFRLQDDADPSRASGYTIAEIETRSNDETWGPQANVFIDVTRKVDPPSDNYDIYNDGVDSNGRNWTLEMTAVRSTSTNNRLADFQIYFIRKFDNEAVFDAITFRSYGTIIVSDQDKFSALIDHEIGHSFGLDNNFHSNGMGDVFEAEMEPDALGIRRVDWNAVNE